MTSKIRATPYFRGASEEAFDGVIKAIDLRGDVPLCKLLLSGSNNEIDCTFIGYNLERMKDVIDQRAWVEGSAIYDGQSGLPVRIEIKSHRAIKTTGDPLSWRGVMSKKIDREVRLQPYNRYVKWRADGYPGARLGPSSYYEED